MLDRCALTNNQVAPSSACNAQSLCFNTPATCVDLCNYTCGTQNRYFVRTDSSIRPFDAIPNITSISRSPTVVEHSNIFSQRAQITVTFCDHKYNDDGWDPYLLERHGKYPKDDDVPGTFWRRFRKRYEFLSGRMLRFWYGPADGVFPDDFTREEYVLQGKPAINGDSVTLRGSDLLSLTNDTKCPELQTVRIVSGADEPIQLSTDIDEASNNTVIAQFPLAGNDRMRDWLTDHPFVCIGTELIRVKLNTTTDDQVTLTSVVRGECSEAAAHRRGDALRPVLHIPEKTHIADLVPLLLECAPIEATVQACCDSPDEVRINTASFEHFRECSWWAISGAPVFLCNDESISDLLNELAFEFGFNLFQNPDTGLIDIQAIQAPVNCESLPVIDDRWLENELAETPEEGRRLSRIAVFYGLTNCAAGAEQDNTQNFTGVALADSLAEPCDRLTYQEIVQHEHVSRWVGPCTVWSLKRSLRRLIKQRESEPDIVPFVYQRDALPEGLKLGGYAITRADDLQSAIGTDCNRVYRIRSLYLNTELGCWEGTAISTTYRRDVQYVSNACDPGCGPFPPPGAESCAELDCLRTW